MKKFICLILLAALMLSLCACGSKLTKDQNNVLKAVTKTLKSDAVKEATSLAKENGLNNPYKITNATLVTTDDYYGYKVNCVVINLVCDVIVGDIYYDQIQIAMDLNSGKVYNTVSPEHQDWITRLEMQSESDMYSEIMSCYYGYINSSDGYLIGGAELRDLSSDDIAAINAELQK